jgi:hypothetical protein
VFVRRIGDGGRHSRAQFDSGSAEIVESMDKMWTVRPGGGRP